MQRLMVLQPNLLQAVFQGSLSRRKAVEQEYLPYINTLLAYYHWYDRHQHTEPEKPPMRFNLRSSSWWDKGIPSQSTVIIVVVIVVVDLQPLSQQHSHIELQLARHALLSTKVE